MKENQFNEQNGMARTDHSFLADLRQEIFNAQERRGKLLTLKLTFISSFFGIGAFGEFSSMNIPVGADYIFYVIPFIALIFDLYLMGEDYGIKRAGNFLKTYPTTSKAEKKWEIFVEEGKRDRFSTWAYRSSSMLIVGFCIYVLRHSWPEPFFIVWLVFCGLSIGLQFYYKYYLKKKLSSDVGNEKSQQSRVIGMIRKFPLFTRSHKKDK